MYNIWNNNNNKQNIKVMNALIFLVHSRLTIFFTILYEKEKKRVQSERPLYPNNAYHVTKQTAFHFSSIHSFSIWNIF